MKVLLVQPPSVRIKFNISGVYPLPPLGLAYIAAVLEKNNFSVDILDMPALKMRISDIQAYLNRNNYSICGISCNIFNLRNGIKIARFIKQSDSKIKIVLGGRCNVFPPEMLFEYGPDFDITVNSEGEEAMLSLCNNLREDGSFANLNNIYGISYRTGNKIINNPATSFLNLDELPFPARHLLPNRFYKMHPPFNLYPPVALIETSRGCIYNCIFCSLSQPVRQRSVGNIIEEIREVTNKFKAREIHFIDPNFTYDQNRIIELCDRLIEEDFKIAWTCKTRIDLVARPLLEKMHKAGCYMISYGVESGSQEILDSLKKDIKVEDIKNTFQLTRKSKIRTLAYILLGAPGENDVTVRQTLNLVEEIRPDFILYGELLPAPNSSLMKEAVENKMIAYRDLMNFYIFNKDEISVKANIHGFPQEKINQWLSLANRSFYFNISYILRRLMGLKNTNDFLNLVRGVFYLLLDKTKLNNFS